MFWLHGSTAFQAFIPSSISVAILLGIYCRGNVMSMPCNDNWLDCAYASGAMMMCLQQAQNIGVTTTD
eukprot:8935755-Ditylum_brightwellii.AAC.1